MKQEGGSLKENIPQQVSSRNALKYSDEDVDEMFRRKFAAIAKKHQKELNKVKHLVEMEKLAKTIFAKEKIDISDELLNVLVFEEAEKTKYAVESFIKLYRKALTSATEEYEKEPTYKREIIQVSIQRN